MKYEDDKLTTKMRSFLRIIIYLKKSVILFACYKNPLPLHL